MDIFIWVIPILLAITVHEYAHGWVAYKLGDGTAKSMGRLTLNPIAHIDLIGTVAVPILLYMTSGFVFGWAKPVPINYNNLSDKKHGVLKVSVAGPISNALMAIAWGVVAYIGLMVFQSELIMKIGAIGVFFNILLGVFNMLPIPPLDGSVMLRMMLPYKYKNLYDRYEIYGIFLVMALIFMGLLQFIVWPIIMGIVGVFPGMEQMIAIALKQ
jgi:Zn-dependent protease